MIRQFFLTTAILGLAISLAPAPTFADMFWLDRSAPDVDVTRRWWRKGDLSDPATNQGRYHPGDALWHNPRNEHEDWLFEQQIDDWRTSYQRGRYIRYADGGPQRAIRPVAPPLIALNRHERPGVILVDTGNRQLFFVLSPWRAYLYPISVGRWAYKWTGKIRITAIKNWPELELAPDGRKGQAWMPKKMLGGLRNPLGARAFYLGNTGCSIHGTHAPRSIGQATRSGCFAMRNAHVVHLASLVKVGTTVRVLRRYKGAMGHADD